MPVNCRDATEPCRILLELAHDYGVTDAIAYASMTLAQKGHPGWLLMVGKPEFWHGPDESLAAEMGVPLEQVRATMAKAVAAADVPERGFWLIDMRCVRAILRGS